MDNLLNFIFEYDCLLTIYTEDDSESKWNICANDVKLIFVCLWKKPEVAWRHLFLWYLKLGKW